MTFLPYDKLQIKNIYLDNWGPFVDEQILFSIDDSYQVTYFYGNNGSGKTSIFQALKWCIFPNEPLVHLDKNELKAILNNTSKDLAEKSSKDKLTITVKVEFDVYNKLKQITNYEITRKQDMECIQGEWKEQNKSKFEITKTINKRPETLTEIKYLQEIERIFPSGFRQFFFLDGERMAENFRTKNMRNIQGMTQQLSEIPILEKIYDGIPDFISKLENRLNRERREEVRNQKNVDAVEDFQKAVKDFQKQLDEKEKEKKTCAQRKNDIEDQIRDGLSIVPDLRDEREKKLKDVSKLSAKIKDDKTDITNSIRDYVPFILLEDDIKSCLDDIEKKKQKGTFPQILDKELFEIIIKNGKCICGKKLTDEDKEQLKKQMETCPEHNVSTKIENFVKDCKRILKMIPHEKFNIYNVNNRIINQNLELNELNRKIETIEKQIALNATDPDEWMRKFKKYQDYNSDLRNLDNDIEGLQRKIKDSEESLEFYIKKLESSGEKNPKVPIIEKQISIAKMMREIVKKIRNRLDEEIIEKLQAKASQFWLNLIQKPEHWKKVIIRIDKESDDWRIEPLKKNMKDAPNLSQGERHVLGTSFMTTLVNIFDISYPLVFDSPFGKLDDIVDEKIGMNLPKWTKGQIILFVTSKEHKSIKDSIKNKVGKAYRIISTSDENISKVNPFEMN